MSYKETIEEQRDYYDFKGIALISRTFSDEVVIRLIDEEREYRIRFWTVDLPDEQLVDQAQYMRKKGIPSDC